MLRWREGMKEISQMYVVMKMADFADLTKI